MTTHRCGVMIVRRVQGGTYSAMERQPCKYPGKIFRVTYDGERCGWVCGIHAQSYRGYAPRRVNFAELSEAEVRQVIATRKAHLRYCRQRVRSRQRDANRMEKRVDEAQRVLKKRKRSA